MMISLIRFKVGSVKYQTIFNEYVFEFKVLLMFTLSVKVEYKFCFFPVPRKAFPPQLI